MPKRKRETPKVVPVSSRYADLPKRESRYRIAKNLDAVTRKAKQVYESSEMFIEQKVKRRKSVSWLRKTKFLSVKLIFFYPSVSTYVLGAQKNFLSEMVLLSTHSICFNVLF